MESSKRAAEQEKRLIDMRAFGLTEADYDDVEFDDVVINIWPENKVSCDLFCFMDTQWRAGFDGKYGLDYNVLYKRLDRMKLADDVYDIIFDDVQEMETAFLIELGKYRLGIKNG